MYSILVYLPNLSLSELGQIYDRVRIVSYRKGYLSLMVFDEDHEREVTDWLFNNFFHA